MHAHKMIRLFVGLRQFGNGNGAGVAGDNGFIRHMTSQFFKHLLFNGHIFHHRFNNQVHIFKTGIIGGGGNEPHFQIGFPLTQAMALDQTLKQFPGMGQRGRQGFFGNILQPHRMVPVGGQLRDPTTHHSGPQNANFFNGTRFYLRIFHPVFFFNLLGKEKDADEIFGYVGNGHFRKLAGFVLQTFFQGMFQPKCHCFQCRQRGRIMPAGFLHHHFPGFFQNLRPAGTGCLQHFFHEGPFFAPLPVTLAAGFQNVPCNF